MKPEDMNKVERALYDFYLDDNATEMDIKAAEIDVAGAMTRLCYHKAWGERKTIEIFHLWIANIDSKVAQEMAALYPVCTKLDHAGQTGYVIGYTGQGDLICSELEPWLDAEFIRGESNSPKTSERLL